DSLKISWIEQDFREQAYKMNARQGEYFVFQVGVWAIDHDQKGVSTFRFQKADEMLGMKDLFNDEAFRKDISKIRLVPSCRIGQGGPKVNDKAETSVLGLYAAGESGSGNFYGAYRSAAILWSLVVQGKWAGEHSAKYAKEVKQGNIDLKEVAEEQDRLLNFLKPKRNPISPYEVKKKILGITGEYFGVLRNGKGLKQAIQEIECIRQRDLPKIQAIGVKRYNEDWVEAIEAQNMLDVGEMMAKSALFRTESRGDHYREDYPQMDNENWLCHTLLKMVNGEMTLAKGPVVMTKYKPPSIEECLKGGEPIPI
ncbi:MAG: FAD-binding protein, partial [Desulfobacterales bacterium]|nr:FAD-binding protein [Desulfobacterales bacterium]